MALTTARHLSDDSFSLLSGPSAPDNKTFARWHEGQRRRRLLEGLWKIDLREALRREFEPRRRRLLGMPDTTRNLFRSLITQLAVLYDRAPNIGNASGGSVEAMESITKSAGLWQLAISLQQNTLAQREGLYRFDVPPGDDPKLLARVVPADLVWAWAPPDCPDVPELIYEYRVRKDAKGVPKWTRDCLDIRDPDAPAFRIETHDGETNITSRFVDRPISGDAYPYRKADGTPILPYVLYHAVRTGKLWDPFHGIELVDGSLTVAGLLTQWRHLVRDASWPQRWAINAVVDGAVADPATGDVAVTSDPATLVNFRPVHPGAVATVGQFAPGGDPKTLLESINGYASDLAADFAFYADIKRTHADARSGYAIELSRESQRAAQRRFEPSFSRGDVQSLETIAAIWNSATGDNVAEDGWSVSYPGLPLSSEERRILIEEHKLRAELGITSKPRLLAAVEGITEDRARTLLLQIEIDNARFDTSAPAAAPQGAQEAANREPETDDSPAPV